MGYSDLQTFLTTGVLAFMLTFVRMGTIIMIMPGIGNSYVPANIRLHFALAFSFILFPFLQAKIPTPLPGTFMLMTLILMEFVVGLFIGTVSRVLLSALDVAGMIISTQSSLANAQIFNPAFASQGSIIGGFITLAGTLLIFDTDMHQLLIMAMIRSYELFPLGQVPDVGSMAALLIRQLSMAFVIGVQMTAPFLVVVMLLYIGMGVMSKLMPQVQVFMIAVPLQIWIALVLFALVGSTMMLFWLNWFAEGMGVFLPNTSRP
ncbi:MAG: flagellar biosynthetic protein FliR [Alphaproteobacteria bacterium]|nr:flagellar biosynthetic protein FliR [Alphaproteobacteria bacterium]OIN87296.1 MAG: flagellar biosynthetic protein FliR [Alphaproteobacteria bacterium CG1_02_46_17]